MELNIKYSLALAEVHALSVVSPAAEVPEGGQQSHGQDDHQHGEHRHERLVLPDALVRRLGRGGGGGGRGGGRSGGGGRRGGRGGQVADLHGSGGREGGGAKVSAANLPKRNNK